MNSTNALKLFNLTSVPTQKETKKRPRQFNLPVLNTEVGIAYWCPSCGKNTNITSTVAIQCIHCDHRILEKTRIKTPVTLNAV